MSNTANRGYPKPEPEHFVSNDVLVLIQAYDLIDADIAALMTSVSGKAALTHYHAIADVTGLASALTDKASINHNHALADLSDTAGLNVAPDGYILGKSGAQWVPISPSSLAQAHTHSIADVTNLQTALDGKLTPAALAAASAKGTPVDADTLPITDSAASNGLKKVSWANLKATLKSYFDSLYAPVSIQAVPVGSVFDFAGSSAPSGYLLCYGQEASRTTYAALDAVIGTSYGAYTNGSGAAGTTHFRLPDGRGRVIAGKDDMGGTSANRLTSPLDGDVLGAAGGSESQTLTAAQIPAHSHTASTSIAAGGAHSHLLTGVGSSVGTPQTYNQVTFSGSKGPGAIATDTAPDHTHTATTTVNNSTGGGGAHPNVQPTLILNKIIKA